MGGEERRRSPRVTRQFIVRYRCPEIGQAQWMASPIRDLSGVGIRFFADFSYQVGTVLQIELALPISNVPLAGSGRIVWQRRYDEDSKMTEHGLEFDFSPAMQAQVDKQVAALTKRRSSS